MVSIKCFREGRRMNKEALPLLVGIFIPILIIGLIILYINGYDLITFFMKLNILYYIIVFPIGLGLLLAVLRGKET